MIPVLIVGYKRVEEVKKLVLSCIDSGANHVYIAIDGAKGGEKKLEPQYLQIFDSLKVDFPSIKFLIWIREENLGSATSVITAVDWAFQSETELAILEDDLVISPNLLPYFTENINQLSSKKLMITGSNVFTDFFKESRVGLTHLPVVWGWATNKDNWMRMRNGIFAQQLDYPRSTKFRVKNFLETGRVRALAAEIDAWDVPLSAWMYANQLECLLPSINLVSNRGFGAEATHTTDDTWPLNTEISNYPIRDKSWKDVNDFRILDNEMFDKVMKIRYKHTFSRLRDSVKQKLSQSPRNLDKLETKVNGVRIPKVRINES